MQKSYNLNSNAQPFKNELIPLVPNQQHKGTVFQTFHFLSPAKLPYPPKRPHPTNTEGKEEEGQKNWDTT